MVYRVVIICRYPLQKGSQWRRLVFDSLVQDETSFFSYGRLELTPRGHINSLLFALHFALLAPKGYTVFGVNYTCVPHLVSYFAFKFSCRYGLQNPATTEKIIIISEYRNKTKPPCGGVSGDSRDTQFDPA